MEPRLRKRFDEAVKLERTGQRCRARKILRDLAKLDPKSPAIFCILGKVCWEGGQLDEAANALRKAIKLRPKLEAASLGLFFVLMKSGHAQQAYREAERFLSISESKIYIDVIDGIYANLHRETAV
jgi:predicted Zn-dependent protease